MTESEYAELAVATFGAAHEEPNFPYDLVLEGEEAAFLAMDVAVVLGAKGLVDVLVLAEEEAASHTVCEEHLAAVVAAYCSPIEVQKIRDLATRDDDA